MSDAANKIKSKNRKKRYTFPNENELDAFGSNNIKPKRRHSIQFTTEDELFNYNEKHLIITKNDDGVKKEIIIKKYTKVHPIIDDENIENIPYKSVHDETNKNNSALTNKVRDVLYKIAIKILCYIGIFSCIAI